MAWTERQRALLGAMGLRVWAPAEAEEAASVAAAAPAPAPVPAPMAPAASAPAPAPAPVPAVVPVAAPAALARPALAALGWPALREAVAGCQACGLCRTRRNTVFGVGHEGAHWLVLGEAPGEQEDQQGEPFVGASGQLLDRMLAALRLTRAEGGEAPPERRVYIANTLKCRPPGNRNPSAQELAQCEPFLVRQIELLKPRIVLALGKFAAQALLRSDAPVGQLRGRVHRYQGVPLIVSYHPSYLLRSPLEKARAWQDLCLAAQVAEGGSGSAGA